MLTNAEVLSLLEEKKTENTIQESEEVVRLGLHTLGTQLTSREHLRELLQDLRQKYDLTKEEILQLLNHLPQSVLEAFLCVEQAILDSRIKEEDLDSIVSLISTRCVTHKQRNGRP